MSSWRRTAAPAAVLVGVVIAGGCSSGLGAAGKGGGSTNHAPPENTAAPVDALTDPTHPGLQACTAGLSQDDVANALEITSDFELSCHELIVCGGLATSLGSAVVNILINAALGGGGAQLTYKGNGVYETGSAGAGTLMDVTTTLGFDTSFGKKGDVINFNLLDLATYFTGAKVTATATVGTSGSSYSIGVTFTGLGPGVEFLGLGATPASPLTVDSDKISASLGQIQIQTHIHQGDMQGHSLFTYDVKGPPQPLGSALSGDAMPFQLSGVMGGRADTGQSLTITKWQINYLDTGSSGYMMGTIAFSISGGKYPYSATFTYPNRKAPDVSLACGGM